MTRTNWRPLGAACLVALAAATAGGGCAAPGPQFAGAGLGGTRPAADAVASSFGPVRPGTPARPPRLAGASGFDDPTRLTRGQPPDRDPGVRPVALTDEPEARDAGRLVAAAPTEPGDDRDDPPRLAARESPRPPSAPPDEPEGPDDDAEAPPAAGRPPADDDPGFPDGTRISQAPDNRPSRRRAAAAAAEGMDDDDDDDAADQEDTDLGRSRAGRRGEGGGPTRAEEEDDEDDEDEFKSDLLSNALGLNDSPIGVFGWVQGSFTGNQYRPRNGENFGVNPNSFANAWLFQQVYFVVEKRIDVEAPGDYDWGFRVDSLSGSDWSQYNMVGLFDQAFHSKYFGYDPVQFYGEVHLPWLTEGGIDVKGGRFFSLPGYEDAIAPGRPLNSTTYLFSYAQPFTTFGVMTTWHVTDRLNLYNGAVNGWDRWLDRNYRWGYAGGLVWDSPDERTNVTLTLNTGPIQFPWFFKANYQNPPSGVPAPPFLAGRRNPTYNRDNALLFSEVVIHEATDKLTLILESDQGFEPNVSSFGPGGTPANGAWYGLAGFLLYAFNEKLTGVSRAEAFRDQNGVRTGFNDTYYEVTLGLVVKPWTWLWFRPEVRWDWATGDPAYNDATSKHQFTYGFDTIFLF